MFDPKRYILAGGTVVVALGIGFMMQKSPETAVRPDAQTASLTTRVDADVVKPTPVAVVSSAAGTVPNLDISGIAHTSGPTEPATETAVPAVAEPPVEMAALDSGDPVTPEAETISQSDSCDPEMTATAVDAAMVDLRVTASCLPNARVTLHHNGMMISGLTDDSGTAQMRAPALSPDALFIASFENGAGAVARAQIADFDAYERVVLQWRGEAGFQIHALEYGADYGEAGHIWRDAPGSVARTLNGEGGFMEILGAADLPDSLRAEVYTFPAGTARDGEVVLTAEAVVTQANCNRDIEGQAIEVGADRALKVQDLTLTVPSCEVAGDILLLKNLLQDLKIARN